MRSLPLSAVTLSLQYTCQDVCFSIVTCGKMLSAVTWSEPLKICCHAIQVRNQLGIPGAAKSVLQGAQIFWTTANNFELRPTHFSRGGENFFRGGSASLRLSSLRAWCYCYAIKTYRTNRSQVWPPASASIGADRSDRLACNVSVIVVNKLPLQELIINWSEFSCWFQLF